MKPNHFISTLDSKVAAVIVLYFPDEALLDRLLNSLRGAVSELFIIDNTPNDKLTWVSIDWFVSKNHHVVYHPLGDNYGIAKAQNVGIELAINNNCDHVILFDQDSAASQDMIVELLSEERALLVNGVKVGSVGPAFIDEKTGEYAKVIRYGNIFVNRISVSSNDVKPIQADYLIASGSLIRIAVLQEVGLMRDDLFIDWVDIEWALRAGNLGYLHFVIPKAVMLHSIGDDCVDIGVRKVNLHSDIRNYYIVRNACNLVLNSVMGRRFRTNIFLKIPTYVLFYSMTSKSRFASLKLLLRACVDGVSGRLGKAF
ncbi:glycosyltransferase family 2 protein [Methylotenera sp.]|uniref:glycosyltransferase family 2 protein n=1 Tax=Methylotenera sp. TaxID=2051956 RepID=UPI00272F062B|nr:glycosyltransferase family 2 protein [Methylotenera sp.]MDP2071933.1 glycosyltransferase family 2 protein [Methylotenera sp.]MDP3005558.1 glycosyltransferase family 2 protein [Methylotenera sp.]